MPVKGDVQAAVLLMKVPISVKKRLSMKGKTAPSTNVSASESKVQTAA